MITKYGDAVVSDGKNPEVAEKKRESLSPVVFDDYLSR